MYMPRLNRKSSTRPEVRSKTRSARPSCEVMELRQLLATTTMIPQFRSYDAVKSGPLTIAVAPMKDTYVRGSLAGPGTPMDVQVYLNRGEILSFQSQISEPSNPLATKTLVMWATGPGGFSFDAGSQTSQDTVVRNRATMRAGQAGTYTISIQGASDGGTLAYYLAVRPIALDASPTNPEIARQLDPNHVPGDAADLSFGGGGLYAFLNADATQLTLAGATGRGFVLEGNWTESFSPGPAGQTINFQASGSQVLELVTPQGNIPLPLPPGASFEVTTAPAVADGLSGMSPNASKGRYGEVASTRIKAFNLPLQSLMQTVGDQFNLNLTGPSAGSVGNVNVFGTSWGIALGGDSNVSGFDAHADPAVPYIYLTSSTAVGLQYGDTTLNYSPGGAGITLHAAIDPSDPSLFLEIVGLPGAGDLAVAGSMQGLIPYEAAVVNPGVMSRTWYGDFYRKGTLDLSSLDPEIPLAITGENTFNFDPSHKGLANLARSVVARIEDAIGVGKNQAAHPVSLDDLKAISFEVNGTVAASIDLGHNFNLSLPLDSASVSWDGQGQDLNLAAHSENPFRGTPLDVLKADSYRIDANIHVPTQAFDINCAAGWNPVDLSGTSANPFLSGFVDITNSGVSVEAKLNLNERWSYSVYNVDASITGDMKICLNNIGSSWVASFSASGQASGSASGLGRFDTNYDLVLPSIDLSGVSPSDLVTKVVYAAESACDPLVDKLVSYLNWLESQGGQVLHDAEGVWNKVENGLISIF
jgi:hypothetical protein